MRKASKYIMALSCFMFGSIFIIYTPVSIHAAVVGVIPSLGINSALGTLFIFLSGILFLSALSEEESGLEKKIRLTSSIKKDAGLVRYAEEATRNQALQGEMNHLLRELAQDHTKAGLGVKHIPGTDINYMRGRRGARLFYREIENGYEIVGKAAGTGTKSNEEAVIRRLKKLYG